MAPIWATERCGGLRSRGIGAIILCPTARARGPGWKRNGGGAGRWWRAAGRSSMQWRVPQTLASISRRLRPGLSSLWSWWIRRRSSRRLCGAVVANAACLWLAGCLYGFAGGTLPNVKTVAILPFDNDTPEPRLTAEASDAVRQALA